MLYQPPKGFLRPWSMWYSWYQEVFKELQNPMSPECVPELTKRLGELTRNAAQAVTTYSLN